MLSTIIKKIIILLKGHSAWLWRMLWGGIIIWLIIFSYHNFYLTIIAPREIPPDEIIARKQKVNIQLFTAITAKITVQKTISQAITIKNVFDK